MKGQKRLPSLRFADFKDLWELDIVYNRSKKLKVGFVGTCEPFYTDSKNGVLLIRTGNLKGVDIVLNDVKYISKEFHEKNIKSQLYPGDLILARHGGNGEICLVPENFPDANCLNIVILRTDDSVESRFFQLIYGTGNIQRQIEAVTAGSTQTVINTNEIGKLNFAIPSIPEQQKIASFLSSVDKKIAQLKQKKGLLEDYKRGVMQQIFSQELRFTKEDGSAYPDWEEKKLKEIYSFYSTNSFSRDKLNYESGEVRNVHYGDIHTKFSTLFDINDELVPYINKEVDLSKIKKDSYLKLGDLLIADASEDYNDIGKTIEVVNLNDEKVISGLHTFHARPNKHKMALGFSGYLLQSWMIREQVMKIAQGTKVLGISTGRLREIKLFIPSYSEQNQIANFLSAIDKKIAVVQTQIKQTQTFKKGLLQQMFV